MRFALCLLIVAGCAVDEPFDTDEVSNEIQSGPVLLPTDALYACYAVCAEKQRAHCPDWEDSFEAGYGTCMVVCAYWRINRLACSQAYINVQMCRLFSPAPRYTCRADGEPHLTDPTYCQVQERALAACGETIP